MRSSDNEVNEDENEIDVADRDGNGMNVAGESGTLPSSTQQSEAGESSKRDVGWDHAQPKKTIEGKEIIVCNYCNKCLKGGGISRLKYHLAGIKGNVARCDRAPPEVRAEFYSMLKGGKRKNPDDVFYADDTATKEIRPTKEQRQTTLKKFCVGKDLVYKAKMEIAKFFYDNSIPFIVVKSPSFKSMLVAVSTLGDALKLPSYHELRFPLLKMVKGELQLWIDSIRIGWSQTGCTLMADGWTDTSGRSLINFLIYSPTGTIFWKSIDASAVVKDANNLFLLFDEAITWIGPKNVVQLITDNASNYQKAGGFVEDKYKSISWSPCAAHCVSLMFKDIGKLHSVQELVSQASKVSRFVYNHGYWLAWLRKKDSWREIVRPAGTRFATSFIALHSLFERRDDLQQMAWSREFQNSSLLRDRNGRDFRETVLDKNFWNDCEVVLKILEPLMIFLRIVDRDKVPTMGYVYEGINRVQQTIKAICNGQERLYAPFIKIIESRWELKFKKSIHAAAYFLNPYFQYDPKHASDTDKVVDELIEVFERKGVEDIDKYIVEMSIFRDKKGKFARESVQNSIRNKKYNLLNGGEVLDPVPLC